MATFSKVQSISARLAAWVKRGWMWIGLGISLAALWLTLRGLDVRHVWEALVSANYLWLIPALFFHFSSMFTRSIRWRILLGKDKVDLATSFWVVHIGYLVGNVIHARVGDVARVAVISQRKPVSAAHTLSTVVLERVFDLLAVVLMALSLIPLMQIPPDWMDKVRLLGVLGLIGVIGAVALVVFNSFTERLLTAILARVPGINPERWLGYWRNLVSGFGALGSVRGIVVVLAWTIITWMGAIGTFWAVMMAFMPQAPFHASMFVLAGEAFGQVIPATPGNWGVWEAIARAALVLPFGLPDHQVVSYGLIVHIFEYTTMNVVGLIGLLRYSLSLGQFGQTQVNK